MGPAVHLTRADPHVRPLIGFTRARVRRREPVRRCAPMPEIILGAGLPELRPPTQRGACFWRSPAIAEASDICSLGSRSRRPTPKVSRRI